MPLHYLFNLILKSLSFPQIWKEAFVTPVFKKDDPAHIDKYRPICILCNFSKIFESVIHKRIFFSVKSFITPFQHGFVERRSTITNLSCFSQYVSEALDDNSQVDVIYTDFNKAFDQIDHYVLLAKLGSFGLSNSLLQLFKSYLLDRKLFVKYKNFVSDGFCPTSGVPQGSNLGPLLFLLYVNDIVDLLTCQKLLFADDLKLFLTVNTIQDCQLLQDNLHLLSAWSEKNFFLFPRKFC